MFNQDHPDTKYHSVHGDVTVGNHFVQGTPLKEAIILMVLDNALKCHKPPEDAINSAIALAALTADRLAAYEEDLVAEAREWVEEQSKEEPAPAEHILKDGDEVRVARWCANKEIAGEYGVITALVGGAEAKVNFSRNTMFGTHRLNVRDLELCADAVDVKTADKMADAASVGEERERRSNLPEGSAGWRAKNIHTSL